MRCLFLWKLTSRTAKGEDDDTVGNSFTVFSTSCGHTIVNKITALASDCKYDHTKSDFVSRHYLDYSVTTIQQNTLR